MSLTLPSWTTRLNWIRGNVRPAGVGCDSGSRAVKCVAVKALGPDFASGLEISSLVEVPRPENPASLSELVRAKCVEQNLAGRPTAFSMPDEQMENHQFRLPRLPAKELESAIEWEIKKTVASPNAVFHDVLTTEIPQGFEVSCWIASRDLVKTRYDDAMATGLQPRSLESESSALTATCRWLFPKQPLHRWAIVDLGYASYRMAFLHAEKVSFTRSLYFGLSTLHGQIAGALAVEAVESERLARGVIGGDTESGQAVQRLMQESLYNLCEEFRRSEYFAREQKGLEEVETVVLSGGGACWAPAVEYLRRHLGEKKIEMLDPFVRMQNLPSGVAREQGPQWACAVGLALRGGEA